MGSSEGETRPPWALYLERVRLERNEARFYTLSFQRTLLGWAVVRSYARIGCWQRVTPSLPFDSLDAALPTMRAILRKRLRHGYQGAGGESASLWNRPARVGRQ